MEKTTFWDIILQTIEKAGTPLSAKEIWDKSEELETRGGFKTTGTTPWLTIASYCYMDAINNGDHSIVIKKSKRPAKFYLRKLDGIEISKTENDDSSDKFIHDDVRDAIRDIGGWQGFNAETEIKVTDGSIVDVVWEASIGKMGRIMYVFEVQTKGSIDSLLMNLIKAKNNPSVQGIIAVSDEAQLEKIKKHATAVPQLNGMLRYWDYKEVWQVHESLAFVDAAVKNLKLVPEEF